MDKWNGKEAGGGERCARAEDDLHKIKQNPKAKCKIWLNDFGADLTLEIKINKWRYGTDYGADAGEQR